MSKINLLSSKIYNRIAAGEVVDRPYSVVKELVENSIDSGASSIIVEIQNGGISLIEVSDNGCGIEKTELKKALMPHATSKISSIKDLDDIRSLGFRGEALPSIASVSKIKIQSKPTSQTLGACVYTEGGEEIEQNDCGMTDGTIVTVKNIFFNTPAREKFLKSARSEESEISSIMARFILGNPQIAFKYLADGQLIYQSFGDGLESAFINVYGTDTIKQCFFIDVEKNGFTIKGYIGKHNYTKGTRSHQTIFLNGRYVVNQTISSAISNAYSSYLMKHRYPFYVLNITMPTSTVDINVHPNKLNVRFSNNQIVYGTLYSIISKTLDGSSEALNIVKQDTQKVEIKTNDTNHDSVTRNNINTSIKHANTDFERLTLHDYVQPASQPSSLAYPTFNDTKEDQSKSQEIDIFAENKAYILQLEKQKAEQQAIKTEQLEIKTNVELKYVGQALNTFLVLDDGKDMYLVDQHAAHERILYDNLIASTENKEIVHQPLLIPFVLNLGNAEFDFINSNLDCIRSLGIEIEEFGRNSFKIDSIPAILSSLNLDDFFNSIIDDLFSLKNVTLVSVLKEKLAQKACKSAIKAGDTLDMSQVNVLLTKLKSNLGLKCPHGRPVCVKITRDEIDKWFKRII